MPQSTSRLPQENCAILQPPPGAPGHHPGRRQDGGDRPQRRPHRAVDLRCGTVSPELGTWGIFEFFSIIKMIFLHFLKVNNLFLHQSYLKNPLPVKLTWWKMQKIIFFNWKNLKIVLKYRKCPALLSVNRRPADYWTLPAVQSAVEPEPPERYIIMYFSRHYVENISIVEKILDKALVVKWSISQVKDDEVKSEIRRIIESEEEINYS